MVGGAPAGVREYICLVVVVAVILIMNKYQTHPFPMHYDVRMNECFVDKKENRHARDEGASCITNKKF